MKKILLQIPLTKVAQLSFFCTLLFGLSFQTTTMAQNCMTTDLDANFPPGAYAPPCNKLIENTFTDHRILNVALIDDVTNTVIENFAPPAPAGSPAGTIDGTCLGFTSAIRPECGDDVSIRIQGGPFTGASDRAIFLDVNQNGNFEAGEFVAGAADVLTANVTLDLDYTALGLTAGNCYLMRAQIMDNNAAGITDDWDHPCNTSDVGSVTGSSVDFWLCLLDAPDYVTGALPSGPFCEDDPIVPMQILFEGNAPESVDTDGITDFDGFDGTWTGPGVTDGPDPFVDAPFTGNLGTATFDPSAAGPGIHAISFGAGVLCAISEFPMVVYPSYDPTFTLPVSATCDGAPVALTADDAATVAADIVTYDPLFDGTTAADMITWYEQGGNGVTDNGTTATFDPGGLAPGVYTVCLDIGVSSCMATYCQAIEVLDRVAEFDGTTLCADKEEIDLNDLLTTSAVAGGAWAGTGVAGTMFDPAVAGVGIFTVTYTLAATADCPAVVHEDLITVIDCATTCPPIIADPAVCDCAADPATRQVSIASLNGGTAPYSIVIEGATETSFDATTGAMTFEMFNQEVTWTVNVIDDDGCTRVITGECGFIDPDITSLPDVFCNAAPAVPLAVEFENFNAPMPVVQSFPGDTGAPDGSWDRPIGSGPVISGLGPVDYVVIPFTVPATCTYNISSAQNYDGYIHLYENSFDPTMQLVNLLAADDDGDGGIGTSDIDGIGLTAGTNYFLVVSGFGAGDAGTSTNTVEPQLDCDLALNVSYAWEVLLNGSTIGPDFDATAIVLDDPTVENPVFDPTAQPGSYQATVTVCVTDLDTGCEFCATEITNVYDSFSPLFTFPNLICEEDVDDAGETIPLALTTPIVLADLPAGTTIADVVTWSGGSIVNVMADGSAEFDPTETLGTPVGSHTVCVEVGLPGCKMSHCETITVLEEPNATITNDEYCISEFPVYIDLTYLFDNSPTSPTTPGGDFGFDNGSTFGLNDLGDLEIEGDVLVIPDAAALLAQGAISGNGNIFAIIDLVYTVNTDGISDGFDNDGCDQQDPATLRIVYIPDPFFDAPSSICNNQTEAALLNMENYLVDPNAVGNGSWSSNCPGLISAVGVIDPTAVAVNTLCEITFTITEDVASAVCRPKTHTEVLYIENCEECEDYSIDDLVAVNNAVCSDETFDLTAPVAAGLNGVNVYFGYYQGFIDNPYDAIGLGIITELGSSVADEIFGIDGANYAELDDVSLPPNTTCDPIEYTIVAYLDRVTPDPTTPQAVIDNDCAPIAFLTMTVWPDITTFSVQLVETGESCISYFVVQDALGNTCDGYTTFPLVVDSDSNTGGDINVVINSPAGSPCPISTEMVTLPMPMDGFGQDYMCTGTFTNDDDEIIDLELFNTVNFTGGQPDPVDGFTICSATGVYNGQLANGEMQVLDFGPGFETTFPAGTTVLNGAATDGPFGGGVLQVISNQPWSLTICDANGCEFTIEGTYQFPEPNITVPSFACSSGAVIQGFAGVNQDGTGIAGGGLHGDPANINANLSDQLQGTGPTAAATNAALDIAGPEHGQFFFDPNAFWLANGGPGIARIRYRVTDAVTGCQRDAFALINVDFCEPECAIWNLEPSLDDQDLCDGETLDVDMVFNSEMIAWVDAPFNGGNGDGILDDAEAQLVQFGIAIFPNLFTLDPYTPGNVTPLAPVTQFGGIGQVSSFGAANAVTHTGTSCGVEQYLVYAFLDLTHPAATGLPANCQPFTTDVISVWPDPNNFVVTAVPTGDGCTTTFDVLFDADGDGVGDFLCTGYQTFPQIVPSNGGAGVNVTIDPPANSPCPFGADIVDLPTPLDYAYNSTTYGCVTLGGLPFFENDNDQYVALTFGAITGGTAPYTLCEVSGIYNAAVEADGSPLSYDAENPLTFPAAGGQIAGQVGPFLMALANQPWSATICDANGCETTFNGDYNFPNPEIFMSSFTCSSWLEDLLINVDPGYNYVATPNANLDNGVFTAFAVTPGGIVPIATAPWLTDNGVGTDPRASVDVDLLEDALLAATGSQYGTVDISFTITDIITGCTRIASNYLTVQNCAPECAIWNLEPSLDDQDLCDGETLDVDLAFNSEMIAWVDHPSNGGNGDGVLDDAEAQLVQFSISDAPNLFTLSPYNGGSTVLTPVVQFDGINQVSSFGAANAVTHSGATCGVEQYLIYAFLDLTHPAAAGLPADCQPFTSDVISVWPDLSTFTISPLQEGADCTIGFQVLDANGNVCDGYTTVPATIPGDAAATFDLIIASPAGSPCPSVAITFDSPGPLAYDFMETYACQDEFGNDDDQLIELTLGEITGGAAADVGLMIVGSNDGNAGETEICFTAPEAGLLSFDWAYSTDDASPFWDPFSYDGASAFIIDDGGDPTAGSVVDDAVAGGAAVCWTVNSLDGNAGAATFNLTNFSFVGDVTGPIDFATLVTDGDVVETAVAGDGTTTLVPAAYFLCGGSGIYVETRNDGTAEAPISGQPLLDVGSTFLVYTNQPWSITVCDANGCEISFNGIYNSPTIMVTAIMDELCNDINDPDPADVDDGQVTLMATGGDILDDGLYDFEIFLAGVSIETGMSASIYTSTSGLAAGLYTAFITDDNGCQSFVKFEIEEPLEVVGTIVNITPPTCMGNDDGSATVVATGGTPPYTYAWGDAGGVALVPAQTSNTATGLAAGTYIVTITDANACIEIVTVVVPDGPALVLIGIPNVSICPGGIVPDILLSSTPPNPDVVFSWTGGAACGLADGSTPALGSQNPAIPSFEATDGAPIPATCTVTVTASLGTLPDGSPACETTTTFDIVISDAIDPLFTYCPQMINKFADPDLCEATNVQWELPTAIDQCDVPNTPPGFEVTITPNAANLFAPGDDIPVGKHTVCYTADDGNGNTEECCFMIVVHDIQEPVVTCQADVVVGTDSDGGADCEVDVNADIVLATDNCAADTTWTIAYADGTTDNGTGNAGVQTFPLGTSTICYTLTESTDLDMNGVETDFCCFNITVVDDTDPMLTCPDPEILDCNEEVPAPLMIADLIAGDDGSALSDNCTTLATNFTLVVTEVDNGLGLCAADATDPMTGEDLPTADDPRVITRTYTVWDEAGNSTACTQTFTYNEDTEGPDIEDEPADMEVECDQINANNDDQFLSWLLSNAGATAIDDCSNVEWMNDFDVANWVNDCGETRHIDVEFTAYDECGNTTSFTNRFSTIDTTNPDIYNCHEVIVENAEANHCDAYVNWSAPLADDNCDGDVEITRLDVTGLNSGDRFPVGTTILTYEAMDDCGNADTCTLKIVVNDYWEAPTVVCPDPVIQDNDVWLCSAVVDNIPPVADDNCPDHLAITYTIFDQDGDPIEWGTGDASGNVFPVGENTVTYTVQDQPLLLITEIMQSGTDAIEITNFGPAAVDISCLVISVNATGSGSDRDIVVPAGTVIPVGGTYVESYTGGISATAGACYTISYMGVIYDEVVTNGFGAPCGDWSGDDLMGGDVFRICEDDTDTAADWMATDFCTSLTIGVLNPAFDAADIAATDNGTQTSLQSVPPATATCSFTVTVNDVEDPFCGQLVEDVNTYAGPGIDVVDDASCNESTLTVPAADDCIVGNVAFNLVGTVTPDNSTITLTSPAGTVVELTEIPDTMMMEFFAEKSGGDWTLAIEVNDGNTYTVTSWSLDITCVEDYAQPDVVLDNDPGLCSAEFTWTHPLFVDNCFSSSSVGQPSISDLILTTVVDAGLTGGQPKAVEVYAINDIPDLSIYGLGSANNGGGTDGEEFTFPAIFVPAGTFIWVANQQGPFQTFFGMDADYTSGAMSINGDDAIELFMNGTVVDVFGDIDTDGTGEAWEYLDSWASRNANSGATGIFNIAQWSFGGPNTLDGVSDNDADIVPVGTYTLGTTPIVVTYSSDDPDCELPVSGNIDGKGGYEATEVFCVGTTTVTYTLTDASGNTHECSFDVTVNDIEDPVAICPLDMVFNLSPGQCEKQVSWNLEADDNCNIDTIYSTPPSGTFFDIGVHEVTITAVDEAGNTDECTFTITVIGFQPDTDAMACNPLIQVSLDASCTACLNPDMILEGNIYSCYLDYQIMILEYYDADAPVIDPNTPGLTFDEDGYPCLGLEFVGDTITVKIIGPNGESCWGQVYLEDKTDPEIECADDKEVFCFQSTDPTLADQPSLLTCGDVDITWEDEIIVDNGQCGEPVSVIERTWTATDESGNTGTCVQTITVLKATEDLVVYPPNYDGDDYLPCDGTGWDTNGNGYPDVSETGAPNSALSCSNLGVEMDDLVFDDDECEGTYILRRKWIVIDWCTGIETETNQIIKVADHQAPVMACANYPDINTSVDNYECSATVDLPAPAADDACVDNDLITYTIDAEAGTLSGLELSGIPIGTHTVTYTATDPCGNATECSFEITVTDQVEPSVACDQHTVVPITQAGFAEINASTFDDGSFDLCGEVTFLASRMDPSGFDCEGNANGFAETVTFYCCDACTGVIMVALQVTDEAGNSATCMVEVEVDDILNPVVEAPDNDNIDCTEGNVLEDDSDFISNNSNDGPPAYEAGIFVGYYTGFVLDNCDIVRVDYTESGGVNNCGVGSYSRTFTATDACGNVSPSSTQSIGVSNTDPFIASDIFFPLDYTTNSCTGGLDPEDLSFPYNGPSITENSCSWIAVGHEDLELPVQDPACLKILRTWTVIDECVYNGGTDGIYTDVQIITVENSSPPELTGSCDDQDICYNGDDCGPGQTTTLVMTATDDCTADDDLVITYMIDLGSDGSFGTPFTITANNPDANGLYPLGTHTIRWTVVDGCGNEDTCEYDFTISDCTPPTPYAYNGLSVDIDPTGNVVLWASDFDAGSFDNCDDNDGDGVTDDNLGICDMRLNSPSLGQGQDLTNPPATSGYNFTCADYYNNPTQSVDLWVMDCAGNWAYVSSYIVLQDNNTPVACPDAPGMAMIYGDIFTEEGEDIELVTVNINGSTPGFPDTQVTGVGGAFQFENVPTGSDYDVEPIKDINYHNGVSTFDIVILRQHILDIVPLTSPYKLIAGDVNHSGTVTTFDLVELQQLVLFITDEFENNTSWRFVGADFDFPNPLNPWETAFPEITSLEDITSDMAADFVGVKIGDLQGNAEANQSQASAPRNVVGDLVFNVEDHELSYGEEYTVDFNAKDFNNLLGYQFTLGFDQSALEVVNVEAGELTNMSSANFGLSLLDKGVITTSYDNVDILSLEDDQIVFSVTFKALETVQLSDAIYVNSRYTRAEAYNTEAEFLDVSLDFNNEDGIVNELFELYQNQPNPFKDETVIGFNLPKATTATLTVYDVSGRVIKVIKGDYAKGYNEVSLNRSDVSTSGVLTYQIDTPTDSAIRKMIVIE